MTAKAENQSMGQGGRGSPWTLIVWAGAGALLLAPLIAMRFTTEVAWTASDFAIMGALLFIVCGAFELAVRASANLAYRAASGLAILTGFFIVWVTLAVQIIGDEDPVNLLFGLVLLIGIVGGVLVRFRAAGLAKVMEAVCIAQAAMIAVAVWRGSVEGVIACAVLAASFGACAWLYHKAAARP